MLASRYPGTANIRLLFALIALILSCMPLAARAQVPLTMAKSFNPSTVVVGGTATTTMTVVITNPNGTPVSGISFSDTYPAGLVPDVVGAYTCAAGVAIFTGAGWALSNVTLGAGASCSVPMRMHATTPGSITNTTSLVTGNGVPPGGPASAVLNVLAAAAAAASIPALSGPMLILLALAIAAFCGISIRNRRRE